jgi:hypothetical protein
MIECCGCAAIIDSFDLFFCFVKSNIFARNRIRSSWLELPIDWLVGSYILFQNGDNCLFLFLRDFSRLPSSFWDVSHTTIKEETNPIFLFLRGHYQSSSVMNHCRRRKTISTTTIEYLSFIYKEKGVREEPILSYWWAMTSIRMIYKAIIGITAV